MDFLFVIVFIALSLSAYAFGYIYSFKKQYKLWCAQLFKDDIKPASWSLSRQKNHDRYNLYLRRLVVTGLAYVALFFCPGDAIIPLTARIVAPILLGLVLYIMGRIRGRPGCDKRVRKECQEHGMDIPTLWKNLQGSLGDFYVYIHN